MATEEQLIAQASLHEYLGATFPEMRLGVSPSIDSKDEIVISGNIRFHVVVGLEEDNAKVREKLASEMTKVKSLADSSVSILGTS